MWTFQAVIWNSYVTVCITVIQFPVGYMAYTCKSSRFLPTTFRYAVKEDIFCALDPSSHWAMTKSLACGPCLLTEEACIFSQARLQSSVYFLPVWSLSFIVWIRTSPQSLPLSCSLSHSPSLHLSPDAPSRWQMSRYSWICGAEAALTRLWSSYQKRRLSVATPAAAHDSPPLQPVCFRDGKRLPLAPSLPTEGGEVRGGWVWQPPALASCYGFLSSFTSNHGGVMNVLLTVGSWCKHCAVKPWLQTTSGTLE